jgi:outer membrane protein assembly factor BamB
MKSGLTPLNKLKVLAILILSISSPASAQFSAWPMFRHDANHTGRTPYTGPSLPHVKWTFQTLDSIACSPSIGYDGTLYFGSGSYQNGVDTSFYAVNRDDGSLKWTYPTEGSIFSSPAVMPDGMIFFGCHDCYMYAIQDMGTHAERRWRAGSILPYYSSPVVGPDSTVYFGGLDFQLYAIEYGGMRKWQFQTDWCVFSSPIIGPEGEIYVGSKDHNLYAVEDSVTYGKLRWKHPFGTFYDGHLVDSSVARREDGTLYVGVDPYGAYGQTPVPIDTAFYAVNADGTRRWSFVMQDGCESSPAIGRDGMVYVGSYDGNVYAIRDLGYDYELEWAFQTGGTVDASPTVDGNGVIYIGSRDSTFYALNPDGTVRWSYKAGGAFESSATIDENGILYVGCFDGKMYAFGTGGPDIGIDSIGVPPEMSSGTQYFPAATVQNYRAGQETFDVACLIDTSGVKVYGDTVTVASLEEIAPLGVTFAPWMTLTATGVDYTVTVVAMHGGDANPYNDTLTAVTRVPAGPTGSDPGMIPPATFLAQNFPNPFNPSTTIMYGLGEASHVTLQVFDVSGHLVRTLVDGERSGGDHSEVWDGKDRAGYAVSSGVYFYRLRAGTFIETRKMILLR